MKEIFVKILTFETDVLDFDGVVEAIVCGVGVGPKIKIGRLYSSCAIVRGPPIILIDCMTVC